MVEKLTVKFVCIKIYILETALPTENCQLEIDFLDLEQKSIVQHRFPAFIAKG